MSAILAALFVLQPQAPAWPGPLSPSQRGIVSGTRRQLVNPARYDASYVRLKFPGGDVPADRGACTDVVIRALRHINIDLQERVFRDAGRFNYPAIGRRDPNIDHRRCRNLTVYFGRHGTRLAVAQPTAANRARFQPGDFVFWRLPNGMDHVGVVMDRLGPRGLPLVTHNIRQTTEEDVLDKWPVTGHYRYPRVAGR